MTEKNNENVYAVALLTKDGDGVEDLYVFSVIADSEEYALGHAIANCLTTFETILDWNIDVQNSDDLDKMYLQRGWKNSKVVE